MVAMKLVDLAEDDGIFLFGLHLHDDAMRSHIAGYATSQTPEATRIVRIELGRTLPRPMEPSALRSTICVAIEEAARNAMSRNLFTQRSWMVT